MRFLLATDGLATDGTKFSDAAIAKCCQIVAQRDRTSHLIVSAYDEVVPLDAFAQSVEYAEAAERSEREKAEKHACDAEARIKDHFPMSRIELGQKIVRGSRPEAIVNTAAEWGADPIIMGSHGRGYWERMLLGSEADSVLHHAPCSVLIAKVKNT